MLFCCSEKKERDIKLGKIKKKKGEIKIKYYSFKYTMI